MVAVPLQHKAMVGGSVLQFSCLYKNKCRWDLKGSILLCLWSSLSWWWWSQYSSCCMAVCCMAVCIDLPLAVVYRWSIWLYRYIFTCTFKNVLFNSVVPPNSAPRSLCWDFNCNIGNCGAGFIHLHAESKRIVPFLPLLPGPPLPDLIRVLLGFTLHYIVHWTYQAQQERKTDSHTAGCSAYDQLKLAPLTDAFHPIKSLVIEIKSEGLPGP